MSTLINVKRAAAIFKVPEIDFEKEERENHVLLKVSGDEYNYVVVINKDNGNFKIKAQDKETARSNTLFEGIKEFKDVEGNDYRLSNPFIMFDPQTGEYIIVVKKQIKDIKVDKDKYSHYYWKTIKWYKFNIK